MDKKTKRIIFFSSIFGVLIVLILIHSLTFSVDLKSTTLGIFSSVLASLIFSLVFYLFIKKDEKDDCDKCFSVLANGKIKEIIDKLNSNISLVENGVQYINKKRFYIDEGKFWLDLLNEADDKLDLMGRSLNSWFDEEYRDSFVKKIIELANNGKNINIILLSHTGKSVKQLEKQYNVNNYTSNIEKTTKNFDELIIKKIEESKRKHLNIKYIADDNITYMYINTGASIIVSPYFTKNPNHDNSILLKIIRTSQFGKAFADDFKNCLENGN